MHPMYINLVDLPNLRLALRRTLLGLSSFAVATAAAR